MYAKHLGNQQLLTATPEGTRGEVIPIHSVAGGGPGVKGTLCGDSLIVFL